MKKKIFKRNNVTTGRALFKRWLVNSERVDEKNCEDYIAVLIELNQDIKTKGFSSQNLFSVNVEEAIATIRELIYYPGFDDYLEQRANDKPVILNALDLLLSYEKSLLKNGKAPTDEWKANQNTLYVFRGGIPCQNNHHNYHTVTAVLLGKRDKNIELTVNYCNNCRMLFIDEQSYQAYRKKYGVIIGNIKFKNMEKHFPKEDSLALESPLMLCGYNVRQQGGLTKEERRYVISRILDRGIMTKSVVIKYLSFFIKRNGKKENNSVAAKKWQEDLKFTLDYKMELQAKVPIKNITAYKKN
jgi:hypothetical protein